MTETCVLWSDGMPPGQTTQPLLSSCSCIGGAGGQGLEMSLPVKLYVQGFSSDNCKMGIPTLDRCGVLQY